MATFSAKKTGMNITAWEYYVQGKEDWARYKNLKVENPSSVSNLPILYKDSKGKDTIGFPLKNGTPLELLSNKSSNVGFNIITSSFWTLLFILEVNLKHIIIVNFLK